MSTEVEASPFGFWSMLTKVRPATNLQVPREEAWPGGGAAG